MLNTSTVATVDSNKFSGCAADRGAGLYAGEPLLCSWSLLSPAGVRTWPGMSLLA